MSNRLIFMSALLLSSTSLGGKAALAQDAVPAGETDKQRIECHLQAVKLNRSPTGGSSLVAQVGGDGWVFNADWIVNF